jgi:endoglucanase
MVKKFISVCQRFDIPYQLEPTPAASGTDAESIQTNRDGVPVLLISIPLRYMHTGVETGNIRDIENAGKAVAHMISEIDQEDWEGLLCY